MQEELDISDPSYFQFLSVFDKFKLTEPALNDADSESANKKDESKDSEFKKKGPPSSGDDSDLEDMVAYIYRDSLLTYELNKQMVLLLLA